MIVGIVSGYFNPIHTGHLDYIEGAARKCDLLHVIVNSDHQVGLKGSKEFMDEHSRLRIVGALGCVHRATISIDKDGSVVESIGEILKQYRDDPFVDKVRFMNGGDRKGGNTPESDFCEKNGVDLIYNVGGEKTQSSSTILESVVNE